jgi:hypothetical protein
MIESQSKISETEQSGEVFLPPPASDNLTPLTRAAAPTPTPTEAAPPATAVTKQNSIGSYLRLKWGRLVNLTIKQAGPYEALIVSVICLCILAAYIVSKTL